MGTNQTPDVVERARQAVDRYPCDCGQPGCRQANPRELRRLVPELVAEIERLQEHLRCCTDELFKSGAEVGSWRQMAEDSLGVDTPDEVAEYIRLSGLSINLGAYGEWGQETLQALFGRLEAFGRDCVQHGDMTPAAARMLKRILDGEL